MKNEIPRLPERKEGELEVPKEVQKNLEILPRPQLDKIEEEGLRPVFPESEENLPEVPVPKNESVVVANEKMEDLAVKALESGAIDASNVEDILGK